MPLLNTIIPIERVVDSRNNKLWDDILAEYSVSIVASENDEHSCYTESKSATIFNPPDNICRDSFTHELLHIYIRQKNVFIGSNIKLTFQQSRILSRIFVPKLIDHIGNCLDHIKMFPIYNSLGYDQSKFLFDYHTPKCTDCDIKAISSLYKIGNKINVKAVEDYLGRYFGIAADPNDSIDYTKHLSSLKKIDNKLFVILEDFKKAWIDFDLDNIDPLNSYIFLGSKFYEDMKSWITGKQFT